MDREKQIEEMAQDICVAEQKTNYSCTEKCKKQGICAYCKVIAEHLYDAGYRKQSEVVDKFANKLKEYLDDFYTTDEDALLDTCDAIDDIATEIKEEK